MKLIDTFYLGWTGLRSHFGRSLLTIGSIGTLFYLIFTAQLWFQGLENQYLSAAGQNTDGKVIISANPNYGTDNNLNTTIDLKTISQDITTHGGTIIDATITDFGIVLPESLLPDINTSTTATPILLTPFHALQHAEQNCPQYSNGVTSKIKLYQNIYQQTVNHTLPQGDMAFSVVALTPEGFCTSNLSFQNLDRKNTSIFNSLLKLFPTPESYSNIILDNGNHLPEPNEISASTMPLAPISAKSSSSISLISLSSLSAPPSLPSSSPVSLPFSTAFLTKPTFPPSSWSVSAFPKPRPLFSGG